MQVIVYNKHQSMSKYKYISAYEVPGSDTSFPCVRSNLLSVG